jgi:hypothetical protein
MAAILVDCVWIAILTYYSRLKLGDSDFLRQEKISLCYTGIMPDLQSQFGILKDRNFILIDNQFKI